MEKDIDNKKIGINIRNIREYSNITREELSYKASISVNFLKNLEYGVKGPSIKTLAKLASALNVTIDHLVFGFMQNENDNKELYLLLDSLTSVDRRYLEEIIKNFILATKNK